MKDMHAIKSKILKKVQINFKLAFYHRFLVSLVVFFFLNIGYAFMAMLPKHALSYIASSIDNAIPLVPFFLIFYVAGDLFFLTPFYVVKKEKAFTKMAVLYIAIMLVSFILFALIPVPMHKEAPNGTDMFSKLTVWYQKQDTNFNNFPSLHVSLNLFGLLMLFEHNKKIALYALPLAALIIASTLLIKQHFFVDVIGGILLACLAYLVYLFWTRKDA
jgi:membrane-associated phospholipid phosphatase